MKYYIKLRKQLNVNKEVIGATITQGTLAIFSKEELLSSTYKENNELYLYLELKDYESVLRD